MSDCQPVDVYAPTEICAESSATSSRNLLTDLFDRQSFEIKFNDRNGIKNRSVWFKQSTATYKLGVFDGYQPGVGVSTRFLDTLDIHTAFYGMAETHYEILFAYDTTKIWFKGRTQDMLGDDAHMIVETSHPMHGWFDAAAVRMDITPAGDANLSGRLTANF